MTTPTAMTREMSTLKTRLKAIWESGDYGVFAKYLEKGALEFFDRLNIPPGTRLLDVACGAGQLTIPAARKGIQVTGLDLAANLVQQARAKAAQEGLNIQVDEGDAENLPYLDASFNVVPELDRVDVRATPGARRFGNDPCMQTGRANHHGQLDARRACWPHVQSDHEACGASAACSVAASVGR